MRAFKLEMKANNENWDRRPLTMMMMCLHQIGNLTVQFITVAYRDAQMNSLEIFRQRGAVGHVIKTSVLRYTVHLVPTPLDLTGSITDPFPIFSSIVVASRLCRMTAPERLVVMARKLHADETFHRLASNTVFITCIRAGIRAASIVSLVAERQIHSNRSPCN